MDPPASVPRAAGTTPAATAAADPPEEPPASLVVSAGLKIGPDAQMCPVVPMPSWCIVAANAGSAPARCNRRTAVPAVAVKPRGAGADNVPRSSESSTAARTEPPLMTMSISITRLRLRHRSIAR
jgi:hypothetical protein